MDFSPSAADAVRPAATDRQPSMLAVVTASSAGTAFEWYDFFLFVPLATIISKTFFAALDPAMAYIFALGAFAVGFAFRPLGALIFGRIGDRLGRKATFLATMIIMGVSTFAIGLLPTYEAVGVLAPALLLVIRVLQGLALGGEWGGAAIYIVEHADPRRRGLMSSWLAASAAFGLGGALLAVLVTRTLLGEVAFEAWGWRVPFLFSAVMLAISIWIRLKLHESPVFLRLKAEGARSERPYLESFGQWTNLRRVLTVLFGIMIAQGAVWYMVFFYLPAFMEKTLRVAPETVNLLALTSVGASVPLYVLFGWLSDRIGRKPVMLGGMLLCLAATFPGFHMLSRATNPALVAASTETPVVVAADPADCSVQFDPVGKTRFRSSCDIAKSTLAAAGIPYTNVAAPNGAVAEVRVAGERIAAPRGADLEGAALEAATTTFSRAVSTALQGAGYPTRADPKRIDLGLAFAMMLLFTAGATALYGPQAAALVELFPTRIRYTAMSLPYHVGTGWVGGFLPATVFAIVAATGDIYAGLWYPIGFTLAAVVVAFFALPETSGRPLDT